MTFRSKHLPKILVADDPISEFLLDFGLFFNRLVLFVLLIQLSGDADLAKKPKPKGLTKLPISKVILKSR